MDSARLRADLAVGAKGLRKSETRELGASVGRVHDDSAPAQGSGAEACRPASAAAAATLPGHTTSSRAAHTVGPFGDIAGIRLRKTGSRFGPAGATAAEVTPPSAPPPPAALAPAAGAHCRPSGVRWVGATHPPTCARAAPTPPPTLSLGYCAPMPVRTAVPRSLDEHLPPRCPPDPPLAVVRASLARPACPHAEGAGSRRAAGAQPHAHPTSTPPPPPPPPPLSASGCGRTSPPPSAPAVAATLPAVPPSAAGGHACRFPLGVPFNAAARVRCDWPTAVRRVPGANASPATGTAARPSAEVQRVRTAADVLARPQTVTLPGRYGPGELRRLDPAALSFAASAVVGGGSRGLEAMPPPPPAAAVEVAMPAERRSFDVVVAACRKTLGIGAEGSLPWRIPADLKYFRQLTTSTRDPLRRNAVVMGRRTWESLPPKARPLAERLNVVLSRTPEAELRARLCLPPDVLVAGSLDAALALLAAAPTAEAVESIFVIGGAAVYAEALASERLERAYVTFVDLPANAPAPAFDALLPSGCLDRLARVRAARGAPGPDGAAPEFVVLARDAAAAAGLPTALQPAPTTPPALHGEAGYLALVRHVIDAGNHRSDRTRVGTRSVFGAQLRFNLRDDSFPLLTTKAVFWRGVAEELFWFISGDTSAATLQAKGIKIWDGNSSRAFLDGLGLSEREEGDLGPVYGFQWRHFGARYTHRAAGYEGKGVDQLARAIELLRTNPHDRRIVVSAWNPPDLAQMALPPCHVLFQFYAHDGRLSCQLYQRSADLGLGVPFNIASYALLTRLVAHVTGLQPGELVHTLGDAHVYENHVDALREQLGRTPRPPPKLRIVGADGLTDIDALRMEHLQLVGYEPHAKIAMQMAV
ncbi:hypothetical protein KFE25_005732 [Diacronema lutheri]|uniref:DHFR domain-containing protein n=2 Tax=Diacronema lutheri TaxID=2081491 RepID=A0A8J5X2I7_DIALT|nr:hypothetical protein KFE25_005732 [Diacronema lutheri]